jgi:hypothetical protein
LTPVDARDNRDGASADIRTVTFTKDVYRFDAARLRSGLPDIARRFGASCVVVEESRKPLSVKITFAVTGTTEQLDAFAAAVMPDKFTGNSDEPLWAMLLGD